MKDQKNILNYGFLIFLIIIGILSFFKKDDAFVNAINSLSLPIFLFTISTLLVKSTKYIKDSFSKAISYQDELISTVEETIKLREEAITIKKKYGEEIAEDDEKLSKSYEKSIHYWAYCSGLRKYAICTNKIAAIINFVAALSFAFCLISLIGVLPCYDSFHWINIFSLMLVFFDFFIFEDVMKFVCDKMLKRIREKSEKIVKKDLEESKSA